MKGLILLFKFMTRLPIPANPKFDSVELGKSMKFFPIVGMNLGIIMFIAYYLGEKIIPSPYLLAGILVLLEIALTGALHLDGLSDTFDGIFSYRSKQKMLDIMKDSRIGANGAIALIMYFILKILLLGALGEMNVDGKIIIPGDPMGYALLVTPVIARANSVLNCVMAPYAKSAGSAKDFVEQTTRQGLFFAILISTIYSLAVIFIGRFSLNPVYVVNIIFVTHILGAYFAKLMERKIGGVTGDTLGAVVELSQLIVLLGIYISFNI